tara:strand:- start:34 stop:570 length:537 start_codon:yes stop_codon:yes gene_type:complete
MKNKIIIAIVILCCSFNSSKGQTNNIYAEFMGVGLLGSINYERMVKDNIFARVSYGGFSLESTDYDDYWNDVTIKTSINPLSLGAHYLMGNKLKLEVGGGISYWMISFDGEASGANDVGGLSVSEDGGFLMFYGSLGFRYQNPEGGLNLKAGVSPILATVDGESATLPWPHLAIGYAF